MKKIFLFIAISLSVVAKCQTWSTVNTGSRYTQSKFLGVLSSDSGLILGNVSSLNYCHLNNTFGSLVTFGDSLYFRSATKWINLSRIAGTSTNAFIQGGNAFGADAVLGTTDNRPLKFKTFGTNWFSLGQSGDLVSNYWSLNQDGTAGWGDDGVGNPTTQIYPQSFLLNYGNYINFGKDVSNIGASGFGFRDSMGKMQFKDSLGNWKRFASAGGVGDTAYFKLNYDNSSTGSNTFTGKNSFSYGNLGIRGTSLGKGEFYYDDGGGVGSDYIYFDNSFADTVAYKSWVRTYVDGSTPIETLQDALDNGSTLNKDNTVDGGGFTFNWINTPHITSSGDLSLMGGNAGIFNDGSFYGYDANSSNQTIGTNGDGDFTINDKTTGNQTLTTNGEGDLLVNDKISKIITLYTSGVGDFAITNKSTGIATLDLTTSQFKVIKSAIPIQYGLNWVLKYDSINQKIYRDTIASSTSGVTSITAGIGLSGGTITTSGTITADTSILATKLLLQKKIDSVNANVATKGSGTVANVAALTLGTSGTDLSSTVATGTTTPVITLNVPDASATARGVVTTGTQTIAGAKTFSTSATTPYVNISTTSAGQNPAIQYNDADASTPNYSSVGFNPSISSTTMGFTGPYSGTSGGVQYAGFTGSGVNNSIPLTFIGYHGGTSPTTPTLRFSAFKWDGSTNRTSLASSEIIAQFDNGFGSSILNIKGNGNVTLSSLGTGTVYSNSGVLTNANPSDERLKHSILPMPYGLDEVLQLQSKIFYYNSDSTNENLKYGFIAQDVQKVMPTVVRKLDDEGHLGLESDGIYVAMVKAIQQLEARVKELEKKLNAK